MDMINYFNLLNHTASKFEKEFSELPTVESLITINNSCVGMRFPTGLLYSVNNVKKFEFLKSLCILGEIDINKSGKKIIIDKKEWSSVLPFVADIYRIIIEHNIKMPNSTINVLHKINNLFKSGKLDKKYISLYKNLTIVQADIYEFSIGIVHNSVYPSKEKMEFMKRMMTDMYKLDFSSLYKKININFGTNGFSVNLVNHPLNEKVLDYPYDTTHLYINTSVTNNDLIVPIYLKIEGSTIYYFDICEWVKLADGYIDEDYLIKIPKGNE